MIDQPSISLIIVSHGRPSHLSLALTSLKYIEYLELEVIIVADPESLKKISDHPDIDHVKTATCAEQNIARARNTGLSLAAGELVAFIDDDAIPEPSWLARLVRPFRNDAVAAATGFVRGRNGISYQWRAETISLTGLTKSIRVPGKPSLHEMHSGQAIKPIGTNCAYRASTLRELGGFDTRFHYFLDDADMGMRVAKAGHEAAVVPGAEVFHDFAASNRRRADRTPTTLFDIGASLSVFLRKHARVSEHVEAIRRERLYQRRRLVRAMVAGSITPDLVAWRLRSFDKGVREGQKREAESTEIGIGETFLRFPTLPPAPHKLIAARRFRGRSARARAAKAAKTKRVTLLLLSPTSFYHRLRFTPEGYWLQSGGVFGKSVRSQPKFRLISFANRVAEETKRLSRLRKFG